MRGSQKPSLGSTLQGLGAVLLWGALATLTALSGSVPPFQLAAMTFAIGTCAGFAYTFATGQDLRELATVPWGAWALGVSGLLGFHACYFLALRKAPALEASLIVYLWPLLLVLFSGLLPSGDEGRGLRWWHVVGALFGFAGTILILLGASGRPEFAGSTLGYTLALCAAVIWAAYSVASRAFARVPSTAVIGSCAATALGALLLHLALEDAVWPASATQWLAVLGLGLGPVGLAFYLWDAGMKHGNLRLLGVASYATPLASMVLLVGSGLSQGSSGIWLASLLITGGALLAAKDQIFRRSA